LVLSFDVDSSVFSVLTRPGSLTFPSNFRYRDHPATAGGQVVRQPSGHLAFYTSTRKRFLATDPEGHPLHECEWLTTDHGRAILARARLRLDWGQWVGLKPEGMQRSTRLDLTRKPGWQRLAAQDLREMAAKVMQVSPEVVKQFYGDEDLAIDPGGQATIRHKKDVLYVLEDGTFAQPRFMACMGAMHWEEIDFLPVVELFQSLLPGTGSAAFELIRGLYDDQNRTSPRPLRYRGVPPYPSEAAFRLFCAFFEPRTTDGADPLHRFMDPAQADQVLWLPTPDPPRRFFDEDRGLCITVKSGEVQKVTVAGDPSGLPFVKPNAAGFSPGDRAAVTKGGVLYLRDGQHCGEIPLEPRWGITRDTAVGGSVVAGGPASGSGWRSLFTGAAPAVSPSDAYSAVLLYPDDDQEISEPASQPFVADYLEDLLETDPALRSWQTGAGQILIEGFDAALNSLFLLDRPRVYTVRWAHGAFAQKQAQAVWNYLAQMNRLGWADQIQFVSTAEAGPAWPPGYDGIYVWIPFDRWDDGAALEQYARSVAASLTLYGRAFLAGPETLSRSLQGTGLRLVGIWAVASLPPFRMHQSLLPQSRLRHGLSLFHLSKDAVQ
jgi:hypothetical protein